METPFLTYLTVFKSRIGSINLVLPITGLAFQPSITLSKKLKTIIDKKVLLPLNEEKNRNVFNYLVDKKIISANRRSSGRYKSYKLKHDNKIWIAENENERKISELPVFQVDIWMASDALPSTIGAPTPDNSDEILEFCYQIGILSGTKNTWTAAGQLVSNLRLNFDSVNSEPQNPFVLGLESVALLRQIIEKDGLILREVLREIMLMGKEISRNDVMQKLDEIAERAIKEASKLNLKPQALIEGKNFLKLIRETKSKRERKNNSKTTLGAIGPGVLEHRTAPRLEWLTDLGGLSKDSLPKNSFQYKRTNDTSKLLNYLDENVGKQFWSDEAALNFWKNAEHFKTQRDKLPNLSLKEALAFGYKVMQRVIGPTSIREVCFVASILLPKSTLSFNEIVNELVQWSKNERAITLSGGRYIREPELVHITQDFLNRISLP